MGRNIRMGIRSSNLLSLPMPNCNMLNWKDSACVWGRGETFAHLLNRCVKKVWGSRILLLFCLYELADMPHKLHVDQILSMIWCTSVFIAIMECTMHAWSYPHLPSSEGQGSDQNATVKQNKLAKHMKVAIARCFSSHTSECQSTLRILHLWSLLKVLCHFH